MAEHIEYKLNLGEVLPRIFGANNQHIRHIVFDKKVDDNYDDLLELSVTHDGSKENESHIIARLVLPLVQKQRGEKLGVPVRGIWRVGHLTISEKAGLVQAAGRTIKGVSQHYRLPVKLILKES